MKSNDMPDWVANAVMLWKEDECLRNDPDAPHIGDEWERQFGCLFFDDPVIETWDGGDQDWRRHPGGRIDVRSFDGSEIWRETDVPPKCGAPLADGRTCTRTKGHLSERHWSTADLPPVSLPSSTPEEK